MNSIHTHTQICTHEDCANVVQICVGFSRYYSIVPSIVLFCVVYFHFLLNECHSTEIVSFFLFSLFTHELNGISKTEAYTELYSTFCTLLAVNILVFISI